MQKWEYCYLSFKPQVSADNGTIERVQTIRISMGAGPEDEYTGDEAKLMPKLAILGKEGWEAVGLSVVLASQVLFLFKRPFQD